MDVSESSIKASGSEPSMTADEMIVNKAIEKCKKKRDEKDGSKKTIPYSMRYNEKFWILSDQVTPDDKRTFSQIFNKLKDQIKELRTENHRKDRHIKRCEETILYLVKKD